MAISPKTQTGSSLKSVSVKAHHVIAVMVLGLLVLVMVLFYRNRHKSMMVMYQQVVARTTSTTLAQMLAQVLPPHSDSMARGAHSAEPVLAVDKTSRPHLWTTLESIETFAHVVNEYRADVWVIDNRGWVYADSKTPRHAQPPGKFSRPGINLKTLHTVKDPDSAAPTTTTSTSTIGGIILGAAETGAGLVQFTVAGMGVADAAHRQIIVFVQPIPGTEFLVVVRVQTGKLRAATTATTAEPAKSGVGSKVSTDMALPATSTPPPVASLAARAPVYASTAAVSPTKALDAAAIERAYSPVPNPRPSTQLVQRSNTGPRIRPRGRMLPVRSFRG